MNFITSRLILRDYRKEDWERVHLYGSIPEFSQFEYWGPNTIEDTKVFVNDMVEILKGQPRYRFEKAICLKENDLLIGGCGIRRDTELSQVANLGWAVNPDFQKQGFATEAAKSLIDFGFNILKLSVIYATCDSRNAASYRMMEKLGMKQVGFIKGTKEVKGHIRDSYRYEILPFI